MFIQFGRVSGESSWVFNLGYSFILKKLCFDILNALPFLGILCSTNKQITDVIKISSNYISDKCDSIL